MKAVTIAQPGGADVLRLRDDAPVPPVGESDVLVRITAAGVNRADVLEREGKYRGVKNSGGAILGLEYAGRIEKTGAAVTAWKAGDAVCGITAGGTYAEYVAVPAVTLLRVPRNLSLEEAAAIPEAFTTAYDALFHHGKFGLGQYALIHAAASGVSLAASQLARVAGGFALGTSRSPSKIGRLREHGFEAAFLLDDHVTQAVRSYLAERGAVDVILDYAGAPMLAQNLDLIRSGGRIVQIGTLGGTKAMLDLGALMSKRATLVGTVLRTRSVREKEALALAFNTTLVPLFEAGRLRPVVDRVFGLSDVAQAHTYMETNANFGKILLRVGAD